MVVRRWWRGWKELSPALRWMLVEALLSLTCARVLVVVGLRWCATWMFREETKDAVPPELLQRQLRRILNIASKAVPWESVCLPNAIAGKLMLHRRGWKSTVHLGVGFREDAFHAHAWLEAGSIIITGGESVNEVAPLSERGLPHPRI